VTMTCIWNGGRGKDQAKEKVSKKGKGGAHPFYIDRKKKKLSEVLVEEGEGKKRWSRKRESEKRRRSALQEVEEGSSRSGTR